MHGSLLPRLGLTLLAASCMSREGSSRAEPVEPATTQPVVPAAEPKPQQSPRSTDEPRVGRQLGSAIPASSASTSAPAPTVLRQLDSDEVLGAQVRDESRRLAGNVGDLLLDAQTGQVLAVVLLVPRTGRAAPVERIVDFDALDWRAASQGPVRLRVPLEEGEVEDADESGYSELFDGQGTTHLAGEIREVEELSVRSTRALLVTIRDEENLFHRVLLEGARLVGRRLSALEIGLEAGRRLELDAALTRDEHGKLWIASALAQEQKSLRLRDDAGRVLWTELAQGLLSSRALLGSSLATSDGARAQIVGWRLDLERERILRLCVGFDGDVRSLSWFDLAHDADAGWTCRRRKGQLMPWSRRRANARALSCVRTPARRPSPGRGPSAAG